MRNAEEEDKEAMQLTVRSSLPGGTYHGRVKVPVYQCLRPVNSDDSRNSSTMKRMRKVFILLQHTNNNCVQTNLKFKCVWFQVFVTAVVWGGGSNYLKNLIKFCLLTFFALLSLFPSPLLFFWCVCVCVCVCVSACVRACVRVCVCVFDRE